MTQDEIAKKFGKSRSYITNILGLIKLPEEIKVLVETGKLSMSHARSLSKFEDKDEIVHVGILLGDDKIIHASGKVRIDNITEKGIINTDTGKQTHRLKIIKRYYF